MKLLIANRGEIAVRIIRTAKKMQLQTVAVYSEADQNALHVQLADQAYFIGSNDLSDSYLNIQKIIAITLKSGADAIHPGYGFLAENPEFVKACAKENILFVGPDADVMKLMGNKIEARNFIKSIEIPLVEGITGTHESLLVQSELLQFPLLIKAAAGGGGKGMRIVQYISELEQALAATSREAAAYFGDASVFIEQYVENPRHIEVQILGDKHGNVIHLFDRECSIQRRYQKIIEEAPSPSLSEEMREKITSAAVKIAQTTKYSGAGTIEFLANADASAFYFLEMNTRIQVEHPVSEMITGVDIVQEQIKIALGETLSFTQNDIQKNGHSIECRIYAEDSAQNFMPSPGKISFYKQPEGVRIDSGIDSKTTIERFFDPMISKLIVHEASRQKAIEKTINALNNYHIFGIETNIAYLKKLMSLEAFKANAISTNFCTLHTDFILQSIELEKHKIDKTIPALLYFIFKTQKSKNQAKNLWEEIGTIAQQIPTNILIENNPFWIKQTHTNQYNVNNELFELHEITCKNQELTVLLNGEKIKAEFFERNKLFFVFYENNYFKAQTVNELAESKQFKFEETEVSSEKNIKSPMPGKIIKIYIKQDQEVKQGDVLFIVEAMKMENAVKSKLDARIKTIYAAENELVDTSKIILDME